ncbi:MAG: carboxypeptidase-like regulatory domain-containing protein [Aigarchaeota archaeon]|nr:carboxypeptidase-like regulatory domain-containing protein [Candidatus Pelearchaeum maunauluense]
MQKARLVAAALTVIAAIAASAGATNAQIPGSGSIFIKVSLWGGDLHPGGEGYGIVEILNNDTVPIHVLSVGIIIEGEERFSGLLELEKPREIINGTVDSFNVSLSPPPTAPSGRVKASVVLTYMRETPFGMAGPYKIIRDVGLLKLASYRTFKFNIMDYWRLNPVPNVTVIFERSITKTEIRVASSNGTVFVNRLGDGAYTITVIYDSPYSGERITIHYPRTYSLLDLALLGSIRTFVYDVVVNVFDLNGRRLNASALLGWAYKEAVDGRVVFHNVPRGEYNLTLFWRGVEVFRTSVEVSEPFLYQAPGAEFSAKADVGDLALRIVNVDQRELEKKVRLELLGSGIAEQENATGRAVFTLLPRGEYRISAYMINDYLGEEVKVGETTLRIPENNGENNLTVAVFDGRLIFVDKDGERLNVHQVIFAGRNYTLDGGVLRLAAITSGEYMVKASWLGVKVFNKNITLSPANREIEITLEVYDTVFKVSTLDGKPLEDGVLILALRNATVFRAGIENGTAQLENIPAARYVINITLRGETVYYGESIIAESEKSIIANASLFSVVFVDQAGRPVSGVVVRSAGLEGVSSADGRAVLGVVPVGDYRLVAAYRNITVASLNVSVGTEPLKLVMPLYQLEVVVVSELGLPLDADMALLREGVQIDRAAGSSALFQSLPEGDYVLRLTRGARQVEVGVRVPENSMTRITFPLALEIGGIALSAQELFIILLPIVLAVIGFLAFLAVRYAVRGATRRRPPPKKPRRGRPPSQPRAIREELRL